MCVCLSEVVPSPAGPAGRSACVSLQHHDDLSARPARRGPDRHQPGPELRPQRRCRGNLRSGPLGADPVRTRVSVAAAVAVETPNPPAHVTVATTHSTL